ncbi:hypothetical protein BH23PAT1_BH23PAT1_5550 [soil metagenome]
MRHPDLSPEGALEVRVSHRAGQPNKLSVRAALPEQRNQKARNKSALFGIFVNCGAVSR